MSDRTNTRIARKKAQRQLRVKRTLITLSLMVLVAVVSIGGTIAWLQAGTETITNTFAPTGIEITLTETVEEGIANNTFPLVPSKEYKKDPVVAVDKNQTDVDVYLFVKFDEISNPGTYFTYSSALTEDKGWLKATGLPDNVWYREVKVGDETKEWHLLDELSDGSGKHIKVKSDLKKEGMPADGTVKLEYTAYAIQTAGFEGNVANAWAAIGN